MRTETTTNNAHDLKIGKRLGNLPALRRIGFAANRRLLELQRLSHHCMLAEASFDRPPGPAPWPARFRPALRRSKGHHLFRLENAVFAGLATGVLSAAAFFKGNAAHDASDRIIYNAANGALLFDKDGTGAAAAVRFATVSTGLAMTNNDFVVV